MDDYYESWRTGLKGMDSCHTAFSYSNGTACGKIWHSHRQVNEFGQSPSNQIQAISPNWVQSSRTRARAGTPVTPDHASYTTLMAKAIGGIVANRGGNCNKAAA
jgi:hypothetical protein